MDTKAGEVLARVDPLGTIFGRRDEGDHAVHVKVGPQLLVPDVQHHGNVRHAESVTAMLVR